MSFDLLAPHYRWLEFVLAGGKLQRCRTAFLRDIPPPENVLLLGEGNGRFLTACRRQFPEARLTCVDASAVMLAQARRRLAASGLAPGRLCFVRADALAWTPPVHEAYDLIVTNFFLDCFRVEQLEQITRVVGGAAADNASWLLADFQIASAGPRRVRSELILWLMYAFFRATTRLPGRCLVPPDSFLEEAGFVLRRRAESEWGLLHSDWWERRAPGGPGGGAVPP